MLLGIRHLHKCHVVYRDLKPENVIIDIDGYIRLTDFGLAKEGISTNNATHSLCGTPEYLAPEVLQQKGHGLAVDWWSLGCIIYEMVAGKPPFEGDKDNTLVLFQNIMNSKFKMPEGICENLQDLLTKLFIADPEKRLGGGPGDAKEIMNHPWFAGVNWNKMLKKQYTPPFKPTVSTIPRYVAKDFLSLKVMSSPDSKGEGSNEGKWLNFTYEGSSCKSPTKVE